MHEDRNLTVVSVTVLLIELAMTKQTALKSNLICGIYKIICLHSAWLEWTLLAHKSNNVLCSLRLLQRSTPFALHYYVASFIKSTVVVIAYYTAPYLFNGFS